MSNSYFPFEIDLFKGTYFLPVSIAQNFKYDVFTANPNITGNKMNI